MKALTALLALVPSLALLAGIGFTAPAFSEAVEQKVMLTEVDPTVLATGWRATDILGAKVHDDSGTEIGTLDELIITNDGTVPYAVVSVGGFLGLAAHHVVVPTSAFERIGKKLTLHGATKESLKALPDFTFAS